MKNKVSLNKLHMIIIILGTIFIFASTFHTNIWFDEAYSVGIANQTLVDIWKIGGHDVHPVLYYWMLRIVNLITGGSILAYRLFSVLPIALLGLLGITYIKKDFGEKTGILFSFFTYFLPMMVVYANQIRMYSWAAYIVTILAIYSYRIYLGQSTKKNWIIFGISSLSSIYIHYYGLMAAGLINIFLLIHFIKNKKWKELKWQIILGVIQIVAYIPWLISLISQIKHVSKGFWIEHEPNKLLNVICCQMIGIMDLSIGVIATILMIIILGIIIFRKIKSKDINWKPLIFAATTYISVIVAAIIVTKIIGTEILYYRYLFIITGLYIFAISYILSKENNKYIILTICIIVFILGIYNNIIQIKENYDKNNGKQIEYLKNNIQDGDVLVYSNIGNGSVFASNFLDNKQYFYNPEDWGVVEAYKIWAPQMETYINKDFLKYCTGRTWIIDSQGNGFYNELFNNENFKYVSTEIFSTAYRAYTFNITLVEKVK